MKKPREIPPPPTEMVPAPAQWPKWGEVTACRHCGFRFMYMCSTRGLCQKRCYADLAIRNMYEVGSRKPKQCCTCGAKIKSHVRQCFDCRWDKEKSLAWPQTKPKSTPKPRTANKERDRVELAKLEALIEERYATMPDKKEGRTPRKSGRRDRRRTERPGADLSGVPPRSWYGVTA